MFSNNSSVLMVRESVIGYVYVSSVPIISSEYPSIYNFNQHTYILSKASECFRITRVLLMVMECVIGSVLRMTRVSSNVNG